jgi:hypothetical protein
MKVRTLFYLECRNVPCRNASVPDSLAGSGFTNEDFHDVPATHDSRLCPKTASVSSFAPRKHALSPERKATFRGATPFRTMPSLEGIVLTGGTLPIRKRARYRFGQGRRAARTGRPARQYLDKTLAIARRSDIAAAGLRGGLRLEQPSSQARAIRQAQPRRRWRTRGGSLGLRPSNSSMDAKRTQHLAARRLLQCPEHLRPDARPLRSLPVVQRQPRLAMGSRVVPERFIRLDV